MRISLIAAVARNGVIGSKGGGIPWKLPRDSGHFRSFTEGKWMLLGRKTFLEMSGWFENRTPVVLTRSREFTAEGAYTANSVEEAISLARSRGSPELVVSGGASVYEAALSFVEKMVITRVDVICSGATCFPSFERNEWELVESQFWPKDPENEYDMKVETWLRKIARDTQIDPALDT